MAALLTLPLAGTFLYILDQFLNPRNLAAFAALFALAEVLHRKYGRAALWLVFGASYASIHGEFCEFYFACGLCCLNISVRNSWDSRPRFPSALRSSLRPPHITGGVAAAFPLRPALGVV